MNQQVLKRIGFRDTLKSLSPGLKKYIYGLFAATFIASLFVLLAPDIMAFLLYGKQIQWLLSTADGRLPLLSVTNCLYALITSNILYPDLRRQVFGVINLLLVLILMIALAVFTAELNVGSINIGSVAYLRLWWQGLSVAAFIASGLLAFINLLVRHAEDDMLTEATSESIVKSAQDQDAAFTAQVPPEV